MPGPDLSGRAAPEGPPPAAQPAPQVTSTQPAPARTRDSLPDGQQRRSWRGMPTWGRMSEQVWLRRLALTAIAALAGLLYAWAMGHDTLEYYYAAADRSMSMSWHDFFFGAFDPAGTITVDKLPGALWIQALSVRAFGLHTWAIILPQVIEGILTVVVLYRAVRRLAGPLRPDRRTGPGGQPGHGGSGSREHLRLAADLAAGPGRRRRLGGYRRAGRWRHGQRRHARCQRPGWAVARRRRQ